MSDARRDNNFVTTAIGISSSDGVTIVPLQAFPTNHFLKVKDAATGSDLSGDFAQRDNNHVPVLIALSSVDGVTPVEVYVDDDGFLLVDSN